VTLARVQALVLMGTTVHTHGTLWPIEILHYYSQLRVSGLYLSHLQALLKMVIYTIDNYLETIYAVSGYRIKPLSLHAFQVCLSHMFSALFSNMFLFIRRQKNCGFFLNSGTRVNLVTIMSDCRLPSRCKWDLRSSEILRSVERQFHPKMTV